MENKKLDQIEMDAILEAFAEGRERKKLNIGQSKTFKALIIFINIYVLVFVLIYFLLSREFILALDAELLGKDYAANFMARANLMVWYLVALNIGAYFNFAFKVICLTGIVYVANSTIESSVIFSEMFDFEERPFFSIFVVTRPIFIAALAWSGWIFNDRLESD